MSDVIRLESVQFAYGKEAAVIDIPEFRVIPLEHVFLHGPSGSGKTTLLSLVSGIITPQKGSIQILGTALEKLSQAQRDHFRGNHMGYIFQMFNLIPYLSVKENILLPIKMNKVKRQKTNNPSQDLRELLVDLNISELENKPVHALSIGQQQRVAAARSLMGHPKLIIADEPTSSLDYDARESFIKLLFKSATKNDTTILFVSHDHSLAKLFPRNVPLSQINRGSRTL